MGRIWSQVTAPVRRRLRLGAALAALLPWLAGEGAKRFREPGLVPDPERDAHFIDILVVATVVFAETMVFTALLAVLIVTAMKGPSFVGDPFPHEREGGDGDRA